MRLPDYILRRNTPKGIRLGKLQLSDLRKTVGLCGRCTKSVYEIKVNGADQVQGRYWKGEYFHWLCPTPDEEQEEFGSTQGWISRRGKVSDMVPAGNLPQEEYRFWIGSNLRPIDSAWSMCRCCRTSVYSRDERLSHFKNPDHLVDGDQCSTRLRKAYDRIRSLTICLICKKPRKGSEKWGVPICEDPNCEKEWKFGQDRWIALYAELTRQQKSAEFRMKKQVKGVTQIPVYIDNGGKMTTRPWCQACNMFADNDAHLAEHQKRVAKGLISAD